MNPMIAVQGAKVVGGTFGYFYSKGAIGSMAKAQKELAETSREINLERIKEAYAQNFSGLMDSFIDARVGLADQATGSVAQMSQQIASISGADTSESSFNYENAKSAVNQKFLEGLNNITDEQITATSQLLNQRVAQQDSVANTYNNTVRNIEFTEKQMINKSKEQIASGLWGMAGAGISSYMEKAGADSAKMDIYDNKVAQNSLTLGSTTDLSGYLSKQGMTYSPSTGNNPWNLSKAYTGDLNSIDFGGGL